MDRNVGKLTNYGKRLYHARNPDDEDVSDRWTPESGLTTSEYHVCTDIESELRVDLQEISLGRILFSVPDADRIIKFPRWGLPETETNGKTLNQCEVEVWQEHNDERLMPITDASKDGWWVTMPAVSTSKGRFPSAAEIQQVDRGTPEEAPPLNPSDLRYRDGVWFLFEYAGHHPNL